MKRIVTIICLLFTFVFTSVNAQTPPPTGADIKEWNMSSLYKDAESSQTISETIKVAIVEGDVYFNFPSPIGGYSWIKGTINGNFAIFPMGQFIANYGSDKIYLMGVGEGEGVDAFRDIIFTYNATDSVFIQSDEIAISYNIGTTENKSGGHLLYTTIYRPGSVEPVPFEQPDLVTPPEGLSTQTYEFSASKYIYDDTEGWLSETVKHYILLGVDGIDVYVKGFCEPLPEAWVKGKRVSNDEMTFASGQYYGDYQTETMTHHFFFAVANYPLNNPVLIDKAEFTLNSMTGAYNCRQLLALSASATEMMPYEFYAGASLKKVDEGTGVANLRSMQHTTVLTDLQGRRVKAGAKGLILLRDGNGTRKVLRK